MTSEEQATASAKANAGILRYAQNDTPQGAGGLHPTLRDGAAKDGAPGRLVWVKGNPTSGAMELASDMGAPADGRTAGPSTPGCALRSG
jgi:hypothetical protein